jgi:phosphate acetyltransferase
VSDSLPHTQGGSKPEFNVIGAVPENPELTAYRTIDIARHLEAETLHEGEIATRRVKKVNLLARTVPNADIAIQSADSAARFGIEPRVAMISYSTGESGSGSDVDKVREAMRLARAKRPDLLLDGPLQYDAAAIAEVAATKAPKSPVAGRATVFVFPDLNTGNTTYKAVQRSAHVISIGPMLQGMRRPVNDLSRGALVEDIVYTIALTAIQADQP